LPRLFASKEAESPKAVYTPAATEEGKMAFATETDLRYPIGKFERPTSLTDEQRRSSIAQIEEAPAIMRAAVAGLNDQQLAGPSANWSTTSPTAT
jgi:hypothetical protein